MIGEVIGSYRVVEKLGEGGMGAVYIAQHALIGRRVAIKVLLPQLSQDPGIVNRFFNEARATAQLKHPSIIDLYDFGHHASGSAFIVMELLEGETLAARLRQGGPLALSLAAELAGQIADGLAAAHRKGIVHRDLKPDNVFLVPDQAVPCGLRAKVLDFGIAKLSDDGAPLSSKTRTGAVMGTPTYMSPEQCRGLSSIDLRSDVYSLGCMLFEMVAGRPPFVGEGVGDVIAKHVYEPPPSLRTIAPRLDPIVTRALAKNPDDRQRDMAELISELKPLVGGREPARAREAQAAIPNAAVRTTLGSAAAQLVGSRPAKNGSRAATTALLVGVGLALGGGGWALFGRGPSGGEVTGRGGAAIGTAESNEARPETKPVPPPPAPEVKPTPGPDPVEAAKPARVALTIDSQPAGAWVYRDGVKLGRAPYVAHVPLAEGSAEFVLKLHAHHDARVSLPASHDGQRRVVLSPASAAGETATSGGTLEHGVLDPFKTRK